MSIEKRGDELLGECRRHAPVPIMAYQDDYQAFWPETFEYEWCGEHEPTGPKKGTPEWWAVQQSMEGLSR